MRVTDEKQTFGQWLKEQRKEAGYTLQQAVERLSGAKVTEGAWRHIESGGSRSGQRRPGVPARETVIRYATAIGAPVEEALLVAGYDPGTEYGPGLPSRYLAMYAAMSEGAKDLVHGHIELVWHRDKVRPLFATK